MESALPDTQASASLVEPGGVSFRGVVFPWDCDAMGHLNNKHYLGLFDQAAWHFLLALGFRPSIATQQGIGMADVNQNIVFKRELRAGQLVVVRSYLDRLGSKSITARHDMFDAETGELVATLTSVSAFIDLSLRRSTEVPTCVRAAAQRWLAALRTGVDERSSTASQ